MKKATKEIAVPAEHEVPGLIDRAKQIKADIAALAAELKIIEVQLTKFAETQPHVPLEQEKREGKQALLRSTRWTLPVRFTSDDLIGSFAEGGLKHMELLDLMAQELGGDHSSHLKAKALLERFFDAPCKWERKIDDGVKFRECAAKWLSPAVAPKFIAACRAVDKYGIPKSKTVVALDDATLLTEERRVVA